MMEEARETGCRAVVRAESIEDANSYLEVVTDSMHNADGQNIQAVKTTSQRTVSSDATRDQAAFPNLQHRRGAAAVEEEQERQATFQELDS